MVSCDSLEYVQDVRCWPFCPHTASLQFATHGFVAEISIQEAVKSIGFFKIESTGNTL